MLTNNAELAVDFKVVILKKKISEPGSSVSIVTDYGLDGPSGDEIFRLSRLALGPT